MQYLDNDMDELFNKAGSDYPLRTDVPDFDGILGKLNPAVDAAPKRNYRKYLLLLLLLPVGYLMNNSLDKKTVANGENPPAVSADMELPKPPFSKGGEQTLESLDKPNSKKQSADLPVQNVKYPDTRVFAKPARSAISPAGGSTLPKAEGGRTSTDILSVRNAENTADKRQLLSAKQNFNSYIPERDYAGYTIPRANYSYDKPVISFPNLPIDSSTSNPVKKPKQKSSIYIGVIAGPDISTVKYQSIKNIGFSIGILGGYKFSKHWSVETGLMYNSKKYYTDGKYFDKTKAGISSSVYVESLDGSCNMFEVPVSVRYDFSTAKNRFFATLGATSYFMKKEKYIYDAYAAGSYYEGHRSYNNSGNHLFSNMQFSIGYNRQLSNKINLRIEPYIKVPVRDIGIGNLPITSSGIYFSVMQSIK